ncbi:MAG: hypothetical protein Q8Q18_02260 [bacterium]|nr:hypothetical protein [bacterium]
MPAPPPRPPSTNSTGLSVEFEDTPPHEALRADIGVMDTPSSIIQKNTVPLPPVEIQSPRPAINNAPPPRSLIPAVTLRTPKQPTFTNGLQISPQTIQRPAFATSLYATQQTAPQKTASPIGTMRTYSSDVNQTLTREHLSMSDIARAEEERARRLSAIHPRVQRQSYAGTLILVFLLAIIGGAAAYFGYLTLKPPANLVSNVSQRTPLIVSESQEEIEITSRSAADIREQLRVRLLSADITIATVREYFYTVERVLNNVPSKLYVSSPLFLDAIDSTIPAELARNLADQFMYGIFSFDGNAGFLILKPTSLNIAFASMLKWEDAGLIRDVAPLLQRKSLTQDDIFAQFTDAVISNQDVRIARDSQGKEVLIYSFTSQNNLVLTTDSETFEEVIARLNTPPPVTR